MSFAPPPQDQIPESNVPDRGVHNATVVSVEPQRSRGNDAMALWTFKIDAGPAKGIELTEYTMFEGRGADFGYRKVRDIMEANGTEYEVINDHHGFVNQFNAMGRLRVALQVDHEFSHKPSGSNDWIDVTEEEFEASPHKKIRKAAIAGIMQPTAASEIDPRSGAVAATASAGNGRPQFDQASEQQVPATSAPTAAETPDRKKLPF